MFPFVNTPVPEVVHVNVPLVAAEVAFKTILLFLQIVSSNPAFNIITGLNDIIIVSLATAHAPIGTFVDKTNFTKPALLSRALGVYIAFNKVELLKLPVPIALQFALLADPPNAPERLIEFVNIQVFWSIPALTVGNLNILTVIWSEAAKQVPAGSFEVKVKTIESISKALGVYIPIKLLGLLNVPAPEVVQVPKGAAGLNTPNKFTTSFAHIESFTTPAIAVGFGFIFKSVPLFDPVIEGLLPTTLILYPKPKTVFAGIVANIVPSVTEVNWPIGTGLEKLPNSSLNWAVNTFVPPNVPVIV